MNIVQQSEMLKGIGDDRLFQEMRQPSGQFPLYMVTSEAKRRADMRQAGAAEQAGPPPTTTVQQELMAALASQHSQTQPQAAPRPQGPQMPPQGGVGSPPQQLPPQGITAAPPQQAALPQEMTQGPAQMASGAPQGYAQGGIIRGFQTGSGGMARLTDPGMKSMVPIWKAIPRALPGKSIMQQRAERIAKERYGYDMGDGGRELDPNAMQTRGIPFGQAMFDDDTSLPPEMMEAPASAPRIMVAGNADGEETASVGPQYNLRERVDGDDDVTPGIGQRWSHGPNEGDKMVFAPPPVVKEPPTPQSLLAAERKAVQKEIDVAMGDVKFDGPLAKPAPAFESVDPAELRSTNLRASTTDVKKFEPVEAREITALPKRQKLTADVSFQEQRALKLKELQDEPDPYAAYAKTLEGKEEKIDAEADKNMWLSIAAGGFAMAGAQTFGEGVQQFGKAAIPGMIKSKERAQDRKEKLEDKELHLVGLKAERQTSLKAEADKFAAGIQTEEQTKNKLKQVNNDADFKDWQHIEKKKEAAEKASTENQKREIARYRITEANALTRELTQIKQDQLYNAQIRADNLREYQTASEERKRVLANDLAKFDREQDRAKYKVELLQKKQAYIERRTSEQTKIAAEKDSAEELQSGREKIVGLQGVNQAADTDKRLKAPTAAMKNARAAMADPELGKVMMQQGVGAKLASTHRKALKDAVKLAQTDWNKDGAGLTTEKPDWQQFRKILVGRLGNTNMSGDQVQAYADYMVKKMGGGSGKGSSIGKPKLTMRQTPSATK